MLSPSELEYKIRTEVHERTGLMPRSAVAFTYQNRQMLGVVEMDRKHTTGSAYISGKGDSVNAMIDHIVDQIMDHTPPTTYYHIGM